MHVDTLRMLRTRAAQVGVHINGQTRYDLENLIAVAEQEVQELRLECGRRGLATEGNKQELELRLEKTRSDAIGKSHRKLYYVAPVVLLILGITGLAITLPHTADELVKTMGFQTVYAVLLAIVVDCGFIALKFVDTLGRKFYFNKSVNVVVWVFMISCLVFSAALNGSNYTRFSDMPLLAVFGAVFISGFVFSTFYVGTAMLVRCEDKKPVNYKDPVVILREAAKELERIRRGAVKLS